MKLSLKELYRLSADRPPEIVELHSPNSYYGHAFILKQYVKYPLEYKIKAVIEHGTYLHYYDFWDMEINAFLPVIFTSSEYRHPFLKSKTEKKLYAIGPLINYALHLLTEQELEEEKKRLGKNLLVFPGHSTHFISTYYDIDVYCKKLLETGKDFDSIRICLSWKNILRGDAEKYMKYGFECVTAGHMYDPLFLSRLKDIIELSTVTTSNCAGTHIGYCISMGKPHFVDQGNIYWKTEEDFSIDEEIVSEDFLEESKKIGDAFSDILYEVTPFQQEIVEKYWGLSHHKSVYEMQCLLEETEEMYKKGSYFYTSHFFNFAEKVKNSRVFVFFYSFLLKLLGKKNSEKFIFIITDLTKNTIRYLQHLLNKVRGKK